MSLDASIWAWKQNVGKSSSKLVLLALADRSGADNTAWPSIESISRDTELDRKTIINCISHLESIGLIFDTGERKGVTGKVVVYKLIGIENRYNDMPKFRNSTKIGTVPVLDGNSTENGTGNSTENGTQNLSLNQSVTNNKKSRSKSDEKTFSEWAATMNEKGESLIPEDHYIFETASKMGIPDDFLFLAWRVFKEYYTTDNLKKYTDWRKHFATYVKNNYAKIWEFNRDGECYLNAKGKQYQNLMGFAQ